MGATNYTLEWRIGIRLGNTTIVSCSKYTYTLYMYIGSFNIRIYDEIPKSAVKYVLTRHYIWKARFQHNFLIGSPCSLAINQSG